MHPDTRRLLAAARQAGCRVERTGSGHWAVRGPDGRLLTVVADTPGSRRDLLRARSILRRAGLVDRSR
jgi:hypothetical protein